MWFRSFLLKLGLNFNQKRTEFYRPKSKNFYLTYLNPDLAGDLFLVGARVGSTLVVSKSSITLLVRYLGRFWFPLFLLVGGPVGPSVVSSSCDSVVYSCCWWCCCFCKGFNFPCWGPMVFSILWLAVGRIFFCSKGAFSAEFRTLDELWSTWAYLPLMKVPITLVSCTVVKPSLTMVPPNLVTKPVGLSFSRRWLGLIGLVWSLALGFKSIT